MSLEAALCAFQAACDMAQRAIPRSPHPGVAALAPHITVSAWSNGTTVTTRSNTPVSKASAHARVREMIPFAAPMAALERSLGDLAAILAGATAYRATQTWPWITAHVFASQTLAIVMATPGPHARPQPIPGVFVGPEGGGVLLGELCTLIARLEGVGEGPEWVLSVPQLGITSLAVQARRIDDAIGWAAATRVSWATHTSLSRARASMPSRSAGASGHAPGHESPRGRPAALENQPYVDPNPARPSAGIGPLGLRGAA